MKTKQTKQSVVLDLHSQGLLYFDIQAQAWQTKEEYLSGNVRQKLNIAHLEYSSGVSDLPGWILATLAQNITALKAVQPMAVLPPASPEIKARCAIALGCDLEQMPPADRSNSGFQSSEGQWQQIN